MKNSIRVPNDEERTLFSVSLIKRVVCETLNVTSIGLTGRSRSNYGSTARQTTAYLLDKFLLFPHQSIAKNLGFLTTEEVGPLLEKVNKKLERDQVPERIFRKKLEQVVDALWKEAEDTKEGDSW